MNKSSNAAATSSVFFSDSAGTTPVTGEIGNEYEVTAISTNDLTIRLKDDPNGAGVQNIIPDNSYIKRRWRFADLFDRAPGTSPYATENGKGTADEMHIVVYDTTGSITGFDVDVAGQRTKGVLETYAAVSKHPSAKTPQGNSNYYPDVIFSKSTIKRLSSHNIFLHIIVIIILSLLEIFLILLRHMPLLYVYVLIEYHY